MDVKKNSSRTVSFRIKSDLESHIRSQASRRGTSLNSYVTWCLERSLEREAIADQFEQVQVSKQILNAFLQRIDHDDLVSIAHEVGTPFLREVGYKLYGGANLEVLRRLIEFIEKHIHLRQFSHTSGDFGDQFTIRHGLCRQWSIFSAETIRKYANDIGLEATYEITDNAIMIRVNPKKGKRSS